MPARKLLLDLGGVDPAELQLEVLALLEERFGQRARKFMAFGDLLTCAGGARLVLAQALARIRQRGSAFRG